MTIALELRGRNKNLPRPVVHFWHAVTAQLCLLRIRLAVLSLLGFALDYPFAPRATSDSRILASLCGVLSAAVSATLSLLGDASASLYTLFSDDTGPLFRIGQRLNLCFGEPVFALDLCPEAGPFPTISGHGALALAACALFLFGSGMTSPEPGKQAKMR
jgi:hypothetical protein